MSCKTWPREYSSRSIASSSTTGGVIHPPHTLSRGKVCRSRITTVRPESRKTMLQCFCIVAPQVLDVQDGQIPRFKDLHDLAERRCVGAGENAFSGPGAERARIIAPYEVEESVPSFGERLVDDAPQVPVVFPSDVFQHSHGDERITRAGDVPVIVFDEFHLVVESQFFGSPAGEQDLLARNI